MTHIVLSPPQNIEWERIGDVLRVRGTILEEGLWTGLDKQPVFYPRDIIHEGLKSATRARMKYKHLGNAESVVGFMVAVKKTPSGAKGENITFDKEMIDRLMKNEVGGISPEMDVESEWVPSEGYHRAKHIKFTAFAYVERPACHTCRVEEATHVVLTKPNAEMRGENIGEIFLSANPQNASREDTLKWLKEQLTESKVNDAVVEKMMGILEKAIKEPANLPAATPPATPPAVPPETPVSDEIEEFFRAHLAKPSQAAFLRFLRNKFSEAGLDRAAIAKVIGIIQDAIKVPYPYPYPASKGKKMEGTELESFWTEEIHKLEVALEAKEKEIDGIQTSLGEQVKTKTTELETAKKELEKLNGVITAQKEAEITKLGNDIKAIDPTFESATFLEGVSCPDMKKSLLSKYLERVRMLQPAIKIAGVSNITDTEKQMTETITNIFGSEEKFNAFLSKPKEPEK